ncbi:Uncharacterised protein [Mycobacteroides abscessus subsp. abscessus]|nr:Uncharacterised protein [Mycobacteroides abscessus subsp. abscessus]
MDPPTWCDFSTTSTDKPSSLAASAAAIPVPAPTISRSISISLATVPAGISPRGADAICTYLRRIRVDGAEAKPTGSRRRSRFPPSGR